MVKRILFLVSVSFFCIAMISFESVACCDNKPVLEDVAEWSKHIKNDPSRVDKILKCSVYVWKNSDGAIRWEISDFYLETLLSYPEAFMAFMNAHNEVFREWLRDINQLSFTWYKETPSPLEAKRKEIIVFLERLDEQQYASIKTHILKKLKNLQIRQID